jgi:hypothetical protein
MQSKEEEKEDKLGRRKKRGKEREREEKRGREWRPHFLTLIWKL